MNPKCFEEYLEFRNKLQQNGHSFVTLTLVHVDGSAPQDVGARALVTSTGLYWGSVGGGKIERYLVELASTKVFSAPELINLNLQRDIGMSCGGRVSCFLEPWTPQTGWEINIFGAGHVAQELVKTLIRLDATINCVDSRPQWLEKLPASARLNRFCFDKPENFVDKVKDNSFIVVMTMGHSTDLPVLERVLKDQRRFPYIGVIGSTVKATLLRTELLNLDVDEGKVAAVVCPIGEDFGSNDPVEISYSIVAQLLRRRHTAT